MAKTIIGVMGPGDGAGDEEVAVAFELGQLIASRGWILLTGGRNTGVMHAASHGAHQAGGLTVGILPFEKNSSHTSPYVDIPIFTGMGSARNNINVLSARAVIACGIGLGTLSEIALALKSSKPVIMLKYPTVLHDLFRQLSPDHLYSASAATDAMDILDQIV